MLIKLLVIGDYIMEFVAQWQDLPNTQKYTALSFACFPGFFFYIQLLIFMLFILPKRFCSDGTSRMKIPSFCGNYIVFSAYSD